MTTKELIDQLSEHVIEDSKVSLEHYDVIAGVIGNLAQYLADTID